MPDAGMRFEGFFNRRLRALAVAAPVRAELDDGGAGQGVDFGSRRGFGGIGRPYCHACSAVDRVVRCGVAAARGDPVAVVLVATVIAAVIAAVNTRRILLG